LVLNPLKTIDFVNLGKKTKFLTLREAASFHPQKLKLNNQISDYDILNLAHLQDIKALAK
jgi:hypothetical protein